ncbi:hypothetical protein ACLB1E_34565 [Escherichia coli]
MLSLIDELGETEAISRIKKMIAELEQADANGITVKKTQHVISPVTTSDFKPARIPPVIATKAVEGVKLITTSLLQKLGDIELPELTDSSADEEINITLNRSTSGDVEKSFKRDHRIREQAASPCGESSGKT